MQISRQGFPCLDVDIQLEGDVRLLPARGVVVLGGFVQAQGLVVVWADPLGGIDSTSLQRSEDLTGRHVDHSTAHLCQHFAAQAWGTHLQALEVGDAVDFLVEPTRGLHARRATGHRQYAERLVGFFPQLHTAALVQPGIHFLGIGAKWQGAEKLCGRHFAFPVVRRTVAHFGGAAAYCIEYFQRRHQLASGIDLDLQAAVTHFFNQLGEALSADTYAGEVLRPGGDHFPVEGLAARAFLGLTSGFSLLFATGQCRGCKAYACCCENLTTFHAKLLYCCSGLTTGSLRTHRA